MHHSQPFSPISHSDLCSLDVRAAVVLDALVGRLPGTIPSANDAVSGSAAAVPRFESPAGGWVALSLLPQE